MFGVIAAQIPKRLQGRSKTRRHQKGSEFLEGFAESAVGKSNRLRAGQVTVLLHLRKQPHWAVVIVDKRLRMIAVAMIRRVLKNALGAGRGCGSEEGDTPTRDLIRTLELGEGLAGETRKPIDVSARANGLRPPIRRVFAHKVSADGEGRARWRGNDGEEFTRVSSAEEIVIESVAEDVVRGTTTPAGIAVEHDGVETEASEEYLKTVRTIVGP